MAFDMDTLTMKGRSARVVQSVGADRMGDAWYSISAAGTLAYLPPRDFGRVESHTVPEVILVDAWSNELDHTVDIR